MDGQINTKASEFNDLKVFQIENNSETQSTMSVNDSN